MKEVDDGFKVQKRILERLEAASAILFTRQKREERSLKQSKKFGKFETLTPDQIEVIDAALAVENGIKANEDLEISRLLHWIVVGAGPTGVELCAEMSDFVRYLKHYHSLSTILSSNFFTTVSFHVTT